ncbi:hypothetical protein HMPREF0648_0495 [Prevotella bivia JCVIHMP010]|nr:hypothetical protein HMPREF0648_0495 [Prevotella bivia JCVIHMP010]
MPLRFFSLLIISIEQQCGHINIDIALFHRFITMEVTGHL